MPLWRICDEDWYWFISFARMDYEHAKMGVENPVPLVDMNLWRCRHCAAMVPGGGRTEHEQFHERVGK